MIIHIPIMIINTILILILPLIITIISSILLILITIQVKFLSISHCAHLERLDQSSIALLPLVETITLR